MRKVSDLPIATELILGLRPTFEMNKFQISRDSQALYITMVAKDRLPVFQTDAIKKVTCEALNEARGSGGFLIFAHVIMPDHLHVITNQPNTSAEVNLNPVRAGLVERAIDYRWSSARIWQRCPMEDEPLVVDIDRIEWRRGA